MEFFNQAITVLQTLVIALGAGLGVWGVINLLEGYGNDNPGAKDAGVKISVVVDHKDMFQQAVKVYSGIKVRDCFSVILINAQSRCVVEEFCIPRVDGTEVSIFRND